MLDAVDFPLGAAGPVALATVLGLAAGSFLNVVICRLPPILRYEWSRDAGDASEDLETDGNCAARPAGLIGPRSRCPNCNRTLRFWQLVPIASYVALAGRCASCRWRIPIRYPAVELLSACLSALVAYRFGFGWEMGGALLLTWVLVAIGFIDVDTHLIPDAITLPLLWLGLLFNLRAGFAPLSSAVLGAVGGYLTLWAAYHAFRRLTGKEGLGRGDFKLLAMLGAWLGWQALPVVFVLSSAAGALVGTGLLAFGRHRRGEPLPFGPFLAAAGWLSLMWGEDMLGAYLRRAA